MSADLEMLIARLRWPIGATRWWAMQELAALLLSPQNGGEVSKCLLAELARCRLEAETVEIIYIFWMAAQMGYEPPSDLAETLTTPSLLSDLILRGMKVDLRRAPDPPPVLAPADFEVPARFHQIQGTGIPRVYLTRLTQLERDTGFPFVRQCAFEWSRTENAYPRSPLQGDLAYFVRPIGDASTGCFASRAMLRMITAYQRTLDVARVIWKAPDRFIYSLITDTFPLDPTLAFLRPNRPSWLPALGASVTADAKAVEGFIRSMSDSLSAAQRGAVLLALVSPTYVSNNEIVELSVVRWRKWGSAAIDTNALGARFDARQERWDYGVCDAPTWGLKTLVPASTLEDVLDHETNAAPMAAVYGFSRIGYLQKDLYPSRLYYPIVTGHEGELTVEPSDGELEVSTQHGPMAKVSYWNAGWSPAHPISMSGLCGTALVQTSDSAPAQAEPPPDGHFYLWRVTRLRRSASYESFVLDEPTFGVVA